MIAAHRATVTMLVIKLTNRVCQSSGANFWICRLPRLFGLICNPCITLITSSAQLAGLQTY